MTENEFSMLVLGIKTAYPSFNILPSQDAVKIWYKMLKDLDYRTAEIAIMDHISSSEFPPSIADIRHKCAKQKVLIPDWGEAWAQVQTAIRKFGSYREIEAVESLDELTRETVKRIGFKSLCMTDMDNEMANRAQFRDIYNAIANRRLENAQLSPAVLEARESIRKQNLEKQPNAPSVLIDYADERKQQQEQRADPKHIDEVLRRSGLRR